MPSELNFKITADDAASKVMKDVAESAKDMAKDVDKSSDTIVQSSKDAEDGVKSGFGKIGQFFKDFGSEVLVGVAAGAGTAAGGALIAGMFEAMNREAGSAKLAAQLGLPPELAKEAGAAAGKIYAGAYGESMGEVNDAIKNVALNIQSLDEGVTPDIEDITKSVLDLSAAFGVDMAESTEAVGQLMKTSMAPNAKAALDIVTRGFQQGLDKNGDFLATLNEYSSQFKKFGMDGVAATGLISQGLQGGAENADKVADSIKEFALRAIDGSTSTAAGFKAIGLNAKTMAADIAAGGPKANAALDITLDRLRAMKDPVKQSAAAVQLFGTQAEDMGDALYALDPSSAVAAMGNVEGAATEMGATLGDTTAAKFESFKRSFENALQGMGAGVFDLASNMSDVLAPSFGAVSTAVSSTVDWMKQNKDIIAAIAFVAGVAAVAFGGQALATWAVTTATGAWAAVTGAATTAFWGLTAAMIMNPIGMIVIAVAALVAGLFLLYKHSDKARAIMDAMWKGIKAGAVVVWGYLKPVLAQIGALFVWLWSNVVKPYLGFIFNLYKTVFQGMKLAWEQYLKPAFVAIGQAAMWLWNNAIKPAFGFIFAVWKAVFAGAKILWETVLKPVFSAIAATATWLWSTVLVPAFNAIKYVITNVFIAIQGIWNSILMPVFRAIGAVIGWLWSTVVVPAFNRMKVAWNILVTAFKIVYNNVLAPIFRAFGTIAKWLWEKVLSPTWTAIKKGWDVLLGALKTVYNNVLKPIFDAFGKAVGVIKEKFDTAITGIGIIWDRLKKIVAVPINFVIETIINKGIIGSWNWISEKVLGGAFHINSLVAPVKFATGGIAPGYTPGRDNQLVAVSGGEAIMRPEWTRAVGASRIDEWNKAARFGGISGVQRTLGFADGGIFGGVKALGAKVWNTAKSTVSGVAEFMKNPMGYIKRVIAPFLSQMTSKFSGSLVGRGIGGVASRLVDRVAEVAKGFKFGPNPAEQVLDGVSAGIGAARALANMVGTIGLMHKFGLGQAGKRYSFGAVGPGSYDCSGLAGNFYAIATGRPLYRRYFLANNPSMGSTPGMARGSGKAMTFLIGGQPGTGHVTTRLNGVNYEAFGGNGVPLAIGRTGTSTSYFHTPWHVPGFARGGIPKDGLDSWVQRGWPEPFLFDKGGLLQPGLTLALNRTRRPERVSSTGTSSETISAPIVIKLDSKTVYSGLLKLRRGMGGSWELS